MVGKLEIEGKNLKVELIYFNGVELVKLVEDENDVVNISVDGTNRKATISYGNSENQL